MASEAKFERLVAALGDANRELQRLEDIDYPTAAYKGFSASGETLSEVQEAIEAAQDRVERLEGELARLDEQM